MISNMVFFSIYYVDCSVRIRYYPYILNAEPKTLDYFTLIAGVDGDASGFKDAADISAWADEAVHWCFLKDIVKGKNGNLFDPHGFATRAETATILWRLSKILGKLRFQATKVNRKKVLSRLI